MLKFKKNKKGFTLVEVLLVVVIIGILASLAIPRFMTSEQQSKENACRAQVSQLRTQIEGYFFLNNAYPAASGGRIDASFLTDTQYFPSIASDICPLSPGGAPVHYTYDGVSGIIYCSVSHAH